MYEELNIFSGTNADKIERQIVPHCVPSVHRVKKRILNKVDFDTKPVNS